jgi:hypothetical protein
MSKRDAVFFYFGFAAATVVVWFFMTLAPCKHQPNSLQPKPLTAFSKEAQ